eukprot:GHVT01000491.1.p1 GENE.GHVT01000491.1~~GHVT01000491.1.p1  ORF type:complete len:151 (-),score=23.27 GHVT01000491.1:126-578(-)
MIDKYGFFCFCASVWRGFSFPLGVCCVFLRATAFLTLGEPSQTWCLSTLSPSSVLHGTVGWLRQKSLVQLKARWQIAFIEAASWLASLRPTPPLPFSFVLAFACDVATLLDYTDTFTTSLESKPPPAVREALPLLADEHEESTPVSRTKT